MVQRSRLSNWPVKLVFFFLVTVVGRRRAVGLTGRGSGGGDTDSSQDLPRGSSDGPSDDPLGRSCDTVSRPELVVAAATAGEKPSLSHHYSINNRLPAGFVPTLLRRGGELLRKEDAAVPPAWSPPLGNNRGTRLCSSHDRLDYWWPSSPTPGGSPSPDGRKASDQPVEKTARKTPASSAKNTGESSRPSEKTKTGRPEDGSAPVLSTAVDTAGEASAEDLLGTNKNVCYKYNGGGTNTIMYALYVEKTTNRISVWNDCSKSFEPLVLDLRAVAPGGGRGADDTEEGVRPERQDDERSAGEFSRSSGVAEDHETTVEVDWSAASLPPVMPAISSSPEQDPADEEPESAERGRGFLHGEGRDHVSDAGDRHVACLPEPAGLISTGDDPRNLISALTLRIVREALVKAANPHSPIAEKDDHAVPELESAEESVTTRSGFFSDFRAQEPKSGDHHQDVLGEDRVLDGDQHVLDGDRRHVACQPARHGNSPSDDDPTTPNSSVRRREESPELISALTSRILRRALVRAAAGPVEPVEQDPGLADSPEARADSESDADSCGHLAEDFFLPSISALTLRIISKVVDKDNAKAATTHKQGRSRSSSLHELDHLDPPSRERSPPLGGTGTPPASPHLTGTTTTPSTPDISCRGSRGSSGDLDQCFSTSTSRASSEVVSRDTSDVGEKTPLLTPGIFTPASSANNSPLGVERQCSGPPGGDGTVDGADGMDEMLLGDAAECVDEMMLPDGVWDSELEPLEKILADALHQTGDDGGEDVWDPLEEIMADAAEVLSPKPREAWMSSPRSRGSSPRAREDGDLLPHLLGLGEGEQHRDPREDVIPELGHAKDVVPELVERLDVSGKDLPEDGERGPPGSPSSGRSLGEKGLSFEQEDPPTPGEEPLEQDVLRDHGGGEALEQDVLRDHGGEVEPLEQDAPGEELLEQDASTPGEEPLEQDAPGEELFEQDDSIPAEEKELLERDDSTPAEEKELLERDDESSSPAAEEKEALERDAGAAPATDDESSSAAEGSSPSSDIDVEEESASVGVDPPTEDCDSTLCPTCLASYRTRPLGALRGTRAKAIAKCLHEHDAYHQRKGKRRLSLAKLLPAEGSSRSHSLVKYGICSPTTSVVNLVVWFFLVIRFAVVIWLTCGQAAAHSFFLGEILESVGQMLLPERCGCRRRWVNAVRTLIPEDLTHVSPGEGISKKAASMRDILLTPNPGALRRKIRKALGCLVLGREQAGLSASDRLQTGFRPVSHVGFAESMMS